MIPAQLSAYGPYEESADDLLGRSTRLAPKPQELSPEHVLLSALPEPATGQLSLKQSPLQWLRTSEERERLGRLRAILQREIDAPVPHGSEDLIRCATTWNLTASNRGILITDALIVWAILEDDNSASQALDLAFDKRALQQALEARFSPANQANGRALPQRPKIQDYLEQVPASPEYRYAKEFTTFLDDVVTKVDSCEGSEFVVVYGERGSPLRALKHIIADSLLQPGVRTETLGNLGACHGVLVMSMASIYRLSVDDTMAVLDDALAMCRNEYDKQVLILDHLEELPRHQVGAYAQTVSALTERLARLDISMDMVIGQYWLSHEEAEQDVNFDLNHVLDLPDIKPRRAKAFLALHTENALRDYFEPVWKREGFDFNDDSFTGLILLEPAIIERGNHPKRLPFLAIDVVQSVVGNIKRRSASPDAIKTWVKSQAYNSLDTLKQIATLPIPSERIGNHFASEITRARAEAERLIAKPELSRRPRNKGSGVASAAIGRDEAFVITRELLVLALLADPDITFLYPSEEKLDRILSQQIDSAKVQSSGGGQGNYRSAQDVRKDGH